jgi:hypothetical protein
MRQLSGFLSRFKSFVPPNDSLKKAVAKAVTDIAGVSVSKDAITFGNGVAFVKCSSVAKNAIRIARGQILEEVYRDHPRAQEKIRDIR